MLTITGNGHLTRDPELRTTRDGKAVCNLSVASNRRDSDQPDYVEIPLWEGAAEAAAEHLVKGQAVSFSGRFNLRRWETSEGEARVSVEALSADVEWGRKPRTDDENAPPVSAPAGVDDNGDEIPF